MNRRRFIKTGVGALAAAALLPEILDAQTPPPSLLPDPKHLLPDSDSQYQEVRSYVEKVPISEYHWASDKAVTAFKSIKYSVRIHWGIYSILEKLDASWPFLNKTYVEKDSYEHLYQTWNPSGFDANEWAEVFASSGIQMIAFTTKHHEGFSMFDTKTRVSKRVNWAAPSGPVLENCDLAYSIMETPFKRDIVKEICDSARKHDLKIDLYFSHPDWYDADFRPYVSHPVRTTSAPSDGSAYICSAPDRTPDETARFVARHRAQLSELLTNYGKIDAVCLDMWFGADVWPQLRETILHLRSIQPDVMLRARGIGNYGDYYTPEGFVPGSKENTLMPWMVIYPLGGGFSYDSKAESYKGAAWIVENLVDSVAKGGAFEVGIGPDHNGQFHPTAIAQLQEAGKWLKVYGGGIYRTVARDGDQWMDGDTVRYTQSPDGKTIYAFLMSWPGATLTLKNIALRKNSIIELIGQKMTLRWTHGSTGGAIINLPIESPLVEGTDIAVSCLKISV